MAAQLSTSSISIPYNPLSVINTMDVTQYLELTVTNGELTSRVPVPQDIPRNFLTVVTLINDKLTENIHYLDDIIDSRLSNIMHLNCILFQGPTKVHRTEASKMLQVRIIKHFLNKNDIKITDAYITDRVLLAFADYCSSRQPTPLNKLYEYCLLSPKTYNRTPPYTTRQFSKIVTLFIESGTTLDDLESAKPPSIPSYYYTNNIRLLYVMASSSQKALLCSLLPENRTDLRWSNVSLLESVLEEESLETINSLLTQIANYAKKLQKNYLGEIESTNAASNTENCPYHYQRDKLGKIHIQDSQIITQKAVMEDFGQYLFTHIKRPPSIEELNQLLNAYKG